MASDSFDNDGGRSFNLKRKLSGRKILFFIVGVLALLGIVYAVMTFTPLGGFVKDKITGEDQAQANMNDAAAGNSKAKLEKPATTTFMDLPDMLVNLRSDDPRPSFLKLSVSLELDSNEDKLVVTRVLPRVIDTFQVYLRELRAEQMQGAAGLLRLREELLGRINAAVSPVQVRDVLFREMLVQ